MEQLKPALGAAADAVECQLREVMPAGDGPERRLYDAMRYACLGGGKRLRPFLVLNSAGLFDVPVGRALRAAAAVELIHCYSLIHDDLPAMDDDDLRRGRPTTHRQFDEATAVLAGDALQALAFEVLASPDTHPDAAVRCELISSLAIAVGATGMVGGQMFDIAAEREGAGFNLEQITHLQRMKTGRLIGFSCRAGAILGEAPDVARVALDDYGRDLGLAFQIADDLLDAEGEEAEVGKKVGKDAAAGKATFISVLGIEQARKTAQDMALQAASHLDFFGPKADLLKEVARFVVDRRT